jgi:hypothetical protein
MFYDLAHGGDPHFNPGSTLYPQNIAIPGVIGSGRTPLQPAEHMETGFYSMRRELLFNNSQNAQPQLQQFLQNTPLKVGDEIGVIALPHRSEVSAIMFQVCCLQENTNFEIIQQSTGLVLGTIDATTINDGYINLTPPIYIHGGKNDVISLRVTSWPAPPAAGPIDPNCVFNGCPSNATLCMEIAAKVWAPLHLQCHTVPCGE